MKALLRRVACTPARRVACSPARPARAPAMASSAGAAPPPRPMPFAVARNAHEALRGALKDCQAAAAAGDLAAFAAEWGAFKANMSART